MPDSATRPSAVALRTVRSHATWPFLSDVAKQVASSHEIWPIRRSARPVSRRPTWWSCIRCPVSPKAANVRL